MVSSYNVHRGEEPPISGTQGSGTIFMTHCNLHCVFCQNFPISQMGVGRERSGESLGKMILDLQNRGCHNINWVTPTHFVPQILEALCWAIARGFRLPLVYNTNGYDRLETLRLLDGVVDIYLPDMKYGNDRAAKRYSDAADYVAVNHAAVREMFRQAGPLRTDDSNIACRGLCIRHLVLPEGAAGTDDIFNYLMANYDPHDIYISLMAQYRPLHRAGEFPEINRTVTHEEYEPLRRKFIEAGFGGFYQEISKMDKNFVIDFKKRKSERLTGD